MRKRSLNCFASFDFDSRSASVFASILLCCFDVVGPLVHGMGLFLFRWRIIEDALAFRVTTSWIVRQSLQHRYCPAVLGRPRPPCLFMLCIMPIAAAITTSSSNGDATATFVRHLGVVFLGCVCPKYRAGMCIIPGCRRFCDTLTFLWRGCSEKSACSFLQDCCFFGAKEK